MSASVITPEEVHTWYKCHEKPWPAEDHCSSLACLLIKLANKQSRAYVDMFPAWARDSMNSEVDMDFDQGWWNVKSVTKAAKLLNEVLPKIEAHWSKMQPTTPRTLEGVEALRGLGSALERAIDYVEFPFWKYKKNQAKGPKAWHIPSVLIAKKVIIGLEEAGRTEPGTAKGSIVADVTHKALGHLGYTLDPSAVAKHITGWFSEERRWIDDCRRSRGRILQGRYMHRCPKFGPMDETCPEWPCGCTLFGGIPVPWAIPARKAEEPDNPSED